MSIMDGVGVEKVIFVEIVVVVVGVVVENVFIVEIIVVAFVERIVSYDIYNI